MFLPQIYSLSLHLPKTLRVGQQSAFSFLRLYLFEREQEREREGEADSLPSREPNAGAQSQDPGIMT